MPHAEDAIANLPEAAMGGVGGGIKEGVPEVELNADVKRQGAHGGAALSGGPG